MPNSEFRRSSDENNIEGTNLSKEQQRRNDKFHRSLLTGESQEKYQQQLSQIYEESGLKPTGGLRHGKWRKKEDSIRRTLGFKEKEHRDKKVDRLVEKCRVVIEQFGKNTLHLPDEVKKSFLVQVRALLNAASTAHKQALEGYVEHSRMDKSKEVKRKRENRNEGLTNFEQRAEALEEIGDFFGHTWEQINASREEFADNCQYIPSEIKANFKEEAETLYRQAITFSQQALDNQNADDRPEKRANLDKTKAKIQEMGEKSKSWQQISEDFAELEINRQQLKSTKRDHISEGLKAQLNQAVESLTARAISARDNAITKGQGRKSAVDDVEFTAIREAFRAMEKGLDWLHELPQQSEFDEALDPVHEDHRQLGQLCVKKAKAIAGTKFKSLLGACHENPEYANITKHSDILQQTCKWFTDKIDQAKKSRQTMTKETIDRIESGNEIFRKWAQIQERKVKDQDIKDMIKKQMNKHEEILLDVRQANNLQDARSALVKSIRIIESMVNRTEPELKAYEQLIEAKNMYNDIIRAIGTEPLPGIKDDLRDYLLSDKEKIEKALQSGESKWSERNDGAHYKTPLRTIEDSSRPPEEQLPDQETELAEEIQKYADRANRLIEEWQEKLTVTVQKSLRQMKEDLANMKKEKGKEN